MSALVLTRAQLVEALKIPLIGMGAVLLVVVVLILRKQSRVLGVVLLLVIVGAVAYCIYALLQGAPSRAAAKTNEEGATKVANALFRGGRPGGGTPEENRISLSTHELNDFARKFLNIEEKPVASGDLKRTAFSVGLGRNEILLIERVQLGEKTSTIRYALKPGNKSGKQPQISVVSVQIGQLPVPQALGALLWQSASAELAKILSPGIQGLQIERVDSSVLELAMRNTPAPAEQ